jgi:hypothetical protein
MADLLCFLIIDVKYFEIESMNPREDLSSRLVPAIIQGDFFPGKTRV